ncbi:MAG: hypothetical protein ACU0C9_03025, partial [Paracoccaceae bacterium]
LPTATESKDETKTPEEDELEIPVDNVATEAEVGDAADELETEPSDQQFSAMHDAADELVSFNSVRTGPVDDDGLPSLENVTARFALYADKARSGEKPTKTIETVASKSRITPKAVTAPDVAGDELPEEIAPPAPEISLADREPEPPQHADQLQTDDDNATSVENTPERLILKALAKPQSGFDLQRPPPDKRSLRILGLALTFGLAAVLLLGIITASIFFDRPIAVSKLWSTLSGSDDELTAEPLTAPQIVATQIDALTTDISGLPDTIVQNAPKQPRSTIATSEGNTVLTTLSTPDLPINKLQPLTENELAESDPDQIFLGEITEQEAIVIQSSTGVWVLAPIPPVALEAEQLDEFYVASIDRKVLTHDAIALPGTALLLNDNRPGDFVSPPPYGTQFDLDEAGFVVATSGGSFTPEGVHVFLGSPKFTPPLRPTGAAGFESAAFVAPDLPRIRPTIRPANPSEVIERARLGGLTRAELARKRPVARPVSPQDKHPDINQTPTKLAVLTSRSPVHRPENFASIVKKSRADAQAAAVNNAVASAAAVAAPKVPSIPTTASVAREATINNAIILSQVNLIGVYGSSTDRRALVRLKSGRYVKVQIGDKLDGGKVAAISGNQLQYIKAGRMVTLEIAS